MEMYRGGLAPIGTLWPCIETLWQFRGWHGPIWRCTGVIWPHTGMHWDYMALHRDTVAP